MLNIQSITERARTSAFYLFLLNYGLNRVIPFNKPHGFRILRLEERAITTFLPYKKRNLNHIGGLHACSLATLAEFTTGFLLLCKLDMKKYRLIMKKLEMEFHYQGKMDAHVEFGISDEWIRSMVVEPVNRDGVVLVNCEVKVFDKENNHLSTGNVSWQIKDWEKVKTQA